MGSFIINNGSYIHNIGSFTLHIGSFIHNIGSFTLHIGSFIFGNESCSIHRSFFFDGSFRGVLDRRDGGGGINSPICSLSRMRNRGRTNAGCGARSAGAHGCICLPSCCKAMTSIPFSHLRQIQQRKNRRERRRHQLKSKNNRGVDPTKIYRETTRRQQQTCQTSLQIASRKNCTKLDQSWLKSIRNFYHFNIYEIAQYRFQKC